MAAASALFSKDLGEIQFFQMNKRIILSIDERWLSYFVTDVKFNAIIEDNKLKIVGPEITTRPTVNQTVQSEANAI